jgi:hypothetical protein
VAAPQSLGDTARRQARKRPMQAPATRVYTDADLRPKEGAPESSAANPPIAGEPADAAAVPFPDQGRTAEDGVRAQLDREAEQRKRRELFWRQLAGAALANLALAQREYGAVCGAGVVFLSGG